MKLSDLEKKRPIFTLVVLSLILALQGCAHGPLPFKPDFVIERGVYQEVEDCSGPDSCLQIFIMYEEIMCSHTALRLQIGEQDALFWDPAGGYGRRSSVKAKRENDLVVSPVPTVNEYIQFPKENATDAIEFFEFHISNERADELIKRLRGDLIDEAEGKFVTTTTGLFCSDAVSSFLERFAGDYLPVKKTFLPHNFAKQLYAIPPDRIIIFEEDNKGGYILSVPLNEGKYLNK